MSNVRHILSGRKSGRITMMLRGVQQAWDNMRKQHDGSHLPMKCEKCLYRITFSGELPAKYPTCPYCTKSFGVDVPLLNRG